MDSNFVPPPPVSAISFDSEYDETPIGEHGIEMEAFDYERYTVFPEGQNIIVTDEQLKKIEKSIRSIRIKLETIKRGLANQRGIIPATINEAINDVIKIEIYMIRLHFVKRNRPNRYQCTFL